MKTKLCDAPKKNPQFSTTIKNQLGKDVVCGDPRATRGLVAIMDMYSVIGGAACHWGGPAGLAEGMSALHSLMFQKTDWFKHYNFVNDIGHAENGIYALRANLGFGDLSFESLKGFRSINSKLTGHGESHLYPDGVLLSNGPLGSSIGQAQGLAMSDKLLNNERVTISVISDGACMEGEAKESLAAIPGLREKNQLNPFVLVVSDNNTKLSGRIDADAFSMDPTFNSLANLGWEVVVVDKGNDLQSCYLALEDGINKSKNLKKPLAIILKTTKGYGVELTEKSSSGGHGFPIKKADQSFTDFINEIFQGEVPVEFQQMTNEVIEVQNNKVSTKSDVIKDKIQAGFSKALIELKELKFPIVALSSDLQGSTGVASFHKQFAESSFDLGIAESNMVSTAAGFAKNGFIPVVDTFAAFGVTKGNLPLIMSRLSSCPMIALFTHTGMQDAADGASHQSTTYISALASIPGVKILNPSSKEEAYILLKEAITDIKYCQENNKEAFSYVFFAGRETYPETLDVEYNLCMAQKIVTGDQLSFVATGPMTHLALAAAEKLKKENISVEVINNSQVNFPDLKTIGDSVNKTKKLLTIEDHQIIGGMGSLLNHELKQAGLEYHMKSIGLKGHFGRSAYSANELYDLFGMGVDDIVLKAKELLKGVS